MRPHFNLEWIDDLIHFLVDLVQSHPLLIFAFLFMAVAGIVYVCSSSNSIDAKQI